MFKGVAEVRDGRTDGRALFKLAAEKVSNSEAPVVRGIVKLCEWRDWKTSADTKKHERQEKWTKAPVEESRKLTCNCGGRGSKNGGAGGESGRRLVRLSLEQSSRQGA